MAESGVSVDKNLNILLIGKSGNGISSVSNTIFWKNKNCTTASRLASNEIITYQGSIGTQKFMDRKLTVIDTPGIVESKSKNARTGLIQQMTKAFDICRSGYHAVLLILKFGSRLSEEDKTIFRFIKAIFGDQIYAKYCILIMTYGDNFHIQKESMNIKTFEEWSKKQTGVFETILQDCCNRIILFDNYSKDENSRALLTDQLITSIDLLQVNPYTVNDFQNATKSRQSIVVELKIPRLREKVLKSKQRLLDDYTKAQRVENDNKIFDIELIIRLAKHLQEKINLKLKDTNLHLEETNAIEEFINKLKQDVLKEQDKKQKKIEHSLLLEKTEKERTVHKIKQLEKQLETVTTSVAKAQESERIIKEENIKIKEEQRKYKETEEKLQMQLKRECEETQTHLQDLKILNERAIQQAKDAETKKEEIEKQTVKHKLIENEYKTKIEKKKTKIQQMSMQILNLESQIANLEKNLIAAKRAEATLKSEIERIENLKPIVSDNFNPMEELLKKQLESRQSALRQTVEEAKNQEIEQLKSTIEGLTIKLDERHQRIKELEYDLLKKSNKKL